MKRISGAIFAIVSVGACGASSAAWAEDPVGFYIGGGVGYSTIRSDDPPYGFPGYFNDHQTAWKAIVGIRPLPIVGAELEYIDFGQPSVDSYYNADYYGTDSHPRAAALFGVGYLPLPIPFFDIFGKAGVARLQTDVNTTVQSCNAAGVCTEYVSFNRHDETANKLAYGVGVQSKLLFGLTFRAEYERISSTYGDPDALTVSATFSF
jgi:opacity protein-like surface antigen